MFRLRFLFLVPLFAGIIRVDAQKEQNIWIFGDHQGVDFNGSQPVAFLSEFWQHEGCASISDRNGQLLFYTEGTRIWNSANNLMENGHLWNTQAQRDFRSFSQTQPAVIAEMPGKQGRYYVFSNLEDIPYLFYSVVDMRGNNGLGKVVSLDSVYTGVKTEKMAIVQGNACNFWLVIVLRNGIRNAYEVTGDRIDTVPKQSIGGNLSLCDIGELKFSPNGLKMALACYRGGVELFDFDPETGISSNPRLLDRSEELYGLCFSPDNSKLYVDRGNTQQVFQFDLSQPDIAASKINIVPKNDSAFDVGHLKPGPDNRIYHINRIVRNGSFVHKALNVILYPDSPGMACRYTIDAVPLPGKPGDIGLGLPNEVGIIRPKDSFYTKQEITVCFRAKLKLSVPASSFLLQWSTDDTTREIEVTNGGHYWVSYLNGCKYYTDSFHVTFKSKALPLLSATGGFSCFDQKKDTAVIRMQGDDSTLFSFSWFDEHDQPVRMLQGKKNGDTLAPAAPGNYRVAVSSPDGCDTVIDFTIDASPPFKVAFDVDSFLCAGKEYLFRNTTEGEVETWLWDFGDEFTVSQQHPVHTFLYPGIYKVYLTGWNDKGCTDTFVKTITVDTTIQIVWTSDKQHICRGETVHLQIEHDIPGATSILWGIGEEGWMSSGTTGLQHAFERDGSVKVTVKAAFRACPNQEYTDYITVHSIPLIDLGADTSLCLGSDALLLRNLALNTGKVHYQWSTGDTTGFISVTQPGHYNLTITGNNGCTAKEYIDVQKGCYIDMPNVFTPNGDGINDYFFPRRVLSSAVTNFHMLIFNRWGQMLFETYQYKGLGWDGRFNAQEQPEGTYIYKIEILLQEGRKEVYQGNCTLLR